MESNNPLIAAEKEVKEIIQSIDNPHLHTNLDKQIVINLIQEMIVRLASWTSGARNGKWSDQTKYLGPQHWVLAHGEYFIGHKLPKKYKLEKVQQCFYNSFKGYTKYDDLTYVEGYVSSIFPIQHAWNIDASNQVVDLTLRDKYIPTEEREYFGVPMQFSFISKTSHDRQVFGSVIDNWEKGFPLLVNDNLLPKVLKKLQ